MEPRIRIGEKYYCKKSVSDCFVKGKTYIGYKDYGYPDPKNMQSGSKYVCGFIINEKGQPHAWPYMPEKHDFCHDRWTDYFTKL